MSGSLHVSSLVDLIARTADGDQVAFRGLYAVAGARLFAVCLRMMRNREEAEDVLQEAFIKIWERSYQFDPGKGDVMPWLAAITRNCALDRLRKPGRENVPFDDAVVEEIDSNLNRLDSSSGTDLRRCLDHLRADYRTVLVLSYVNGMTHDELATSLGRPVGTIKSWVKRGAEQLKGCMDS